jgi:transcriptional regulator GlxA family with amidase domain
MIKSPCQVHAQVNEMLKDMVKRYLFKLQFVVLAEEIQLNKDLLSWVLKKHSLGAEIASVCPGAFISASSGLLNGRKCAAHSVAAIEVRSMFPEIERVEYKIITDEPGIYSRGGDYLSLNLILYLVEKFSGRKAAIFYSKAFRIDIRCDNQLFFMIFTGQKEHEDEQFEKACQYTEQNFKEKKTEDQLASKITLSRRYIERRYKKATSNTITEYIQRVKVEAAKLSFE